jgi:uncharacterized Fe-S center protein
MGIRMEKEMLKGALKRVTAELSKLSAEEFKALMEKHKNGDIARMLIETNALSSGEMECNSFEDLDK